MAKPLLSISTLAPDRPLIDIDGRFYELKARDDLGLEDLVQLDAFLQQYSVLIAFVQGGGKPTKEDGAALDVAMDRLLRIFLDAPDAVQDKLLPSHRLSILLAFSEASPKPAQTATQPNRANRRSGAKSSRRSSASTEEPLAIGSGSASPSSSPTSA